MNFRNVKIKHFRDSGDGYSVEAVIDGDTVSHTFPQHDSLFDKDASGTPRFVHKLVEIYSFKDGANKVYRSDVDSRKYENRYYNATGNFKKSSNELSDYVDNRPSPVSHEYFACMTKVI